jgi:hypothetical protein
VEGREVTVGADGYGDDSMEGFEEREWLGWSEWFGGEALG